MRKYFITIGISIALLGTITPVTFAATQPLINQPANGFIDARDPECVTPHSVSGSNEHQLFHEYLSLEYRQWYEKHRAQEGSVSYDAALRAEYRTLDEEHRSWHQKHPSDVGVSTIEYQETFIYTSPRMINQPASGFENTADSKCVTTHATSGSNAHRLFHQERALKYREWREQHRTQEGTNAYDAAFRAFYRTLEVEHRLWHQQHPFDINVSTVDRTGYDFTRTNNSNLRGPTRRSIIANAKAIRLARVLSR